MGCSFFFYISLTVFKRLPFCAFSCQDIMVKCTIPSLIEWLDIDNGLHYLSTLGLKNIFNELFSIAFVEASLITE